MGLVSRIAKNKKVLGEGPRESRPLRLVQKVEVSVPIFAALYGPGTGGNGGVSVGAAGSGGAASWTGTGATGVDGLPG